jgi:hypothetical protein
MSQEIAELVDIQSEQVKKITENIDVSLAYGACHMVPSVGPVCEECWLCSEAGNESYGECLQEDEGDTQSNVLPRDRWNRHPRPHNGRGGRRVGQCLRAHIR